MAGKINYNRYRLITLLYVIFVCLSVLNIPFSLLDSNLYLIRTLEYQEHERLQQVNFANRVISNHRDQLRGDTTAVYLGIKERIHKSYQWADSLDRCIQAGLAAQGTTIEKEFSSKRLIGDVLLKDSLVHRFRDELFALNSFVLAQRFHIDSAFATLLPVKPTLNTQSGKEISWERYLFLHKPTAISYAQVKRIKLLLLDNEYNYQLAALRSIDYYPSFYSKKSNRVFIDRSEDPVINTKNAEEKNIVQPRQPMKSAVPEATSQPQATAATATQQPSPSQQNRQDKESMQDIYQEIIAALQPENLYVGIRNTVLRNAGSELLKKVAVTVTPQVDLLQNGSDYTLTFSRPGDYTIVFTDNREGATKGKSLFEKRIHASLLPSPMVRLNTESSAKDILSVRDLFSLNRLVTTMDIPGQQAFPGRVNGFRLTRIPKTGEQQTAYNYGEVFRGQVQDLLNQLKKGDIVFFDNITISLADGTTRTPNPILYKIVE